jgi:predicted  nucleic acid-binding Zn-ribbon protein
LLQPIYATVDAVVDFVDQFTRLESENIQLHKAVKASVDQVLEANKLAAKAQSENICLKDELKKLKKKMKDEQEARHKAFIEADEKEGALRESIASLLSKVSSYLYDSSPEYFPVAMNCFFIIF